MLNSGLGKTVTLIRYNRVWKLGRETSAGSFGSIGCTYDCGLSEAY